MSNGGDPFAEVDFEALTEAVIQTESGGDPNAVSVDDAIGFNANFAQYSGSTRIRELRRRKCVRHCDRHGLSGG